MDFIFQRQQQQNHPHALLMMWLWHSSHKRWGSTFPSLESRQTRGHSESDTVWLPKLDHILPLLGTPALGTSHHTEDAQATTWRDHCSSWQLQLRSHLTASIKSLKMWASEPSDVKSLQPLNLPSRGPIHHTAEAKPTIVPFPNFWPGESMNLKQWWFFYAT